MVANSAEISRKSGISAPDTRDERPGRHQGLNSLSPSLGRVSATCNNPTARPERGVVLALCAWLAILLIFLGLGRPRLDGASRLVLQALLAASATAIGACLSWSVFRSAGARADP
ncbi:hypothetical protein BH10PSE5_BH10PSE5_27990 [soil metagenome]